jgi:hypothetical protein
MSRLRNEGFVPDSSDGSVAVDLFLRQEPDEDEEDDDNRNDEDHDDEEGTDDGYSE